MAPGEFAGADVDGGTIYVGFTGDSKRRLAELQAAFPNLDLRAYPARHTEDELVGLDRGDADPERERDESIAGE